MQRDVRNKFGVTPEQFADYLALVGDKQDNVLGVPGTGGRPRPRCWTSSARSRGGRATLGSTWRTSPGIGPKGAVALQLRATSMVFAPCREVVSLKPDLPRPLPIVELHERAPSGRESVELAVDSAQG